MRAPGDADNEIRPSAWDLLLHDAGTALEVRVPLPASRASVLWLLGWYLLSPLGERALTEAAQAIWQVYEFYSEPYTTESLPSGATREVRGCVAGRAIRPPLALWDD